MQESDGGAPQADQPVVSPVKPRGGGISLGATTWMALGIVAIVVVATAIVLLGGNPAPAKYPADSPEGAVQRYLTAWYGEDYESAYTSFSSSVQGQMSYDEFLQYSYGYSYGSSDQTITIDRTTGAGEQRTVYLTVEEYYGPQPGNSYSRDATIRLALEDGAWRIDQPLTGVDPYYDGF